MSERKEIRQFYKSSFGGTFPDVPVENVDVEELTRGDNDPMFITLPISQSNAVADDGLKYTDPFNNLISTKIIIDHISGMMGHLKTEDRSSRFDVPAVMWLGSVKDDQGQYWAKGYVLPNPEIRQFIKASKATKRGIATSIYGMVDPEALKFNSDGTYEIDPTGFDLESLDLAPIERAALKINRPLKVTSHMKDENVKDEQMDLKETLAQMTISDIDLLPEAVRNAIIEKSSQEVQISQLKQDNVTLVQTVAQLTKQLEDQGFETALDAEIASQVTIDDTDLRELVKTKVLGQLSDRDVKKITEVVAEYVGSDQYKKFATAIVSQLSGGKAIAGNTSNSKTLGQQMEEQLPEIMKRYGV